VEEKGRRLARKPVKEEKDRIEGDPAPRQIPQLKTRGEKKESALGRIGGKKEGGTGKGELDPKGENGGWGSCV